MNNVNYNRMFQKSYRGRKMKTIINSFYIDGYRNLSNVTLDLHDTTAIIALNNYGKSNLINAIRMGIDFIKGSNDTKNDFFEYTAAFPFLNINYGQPFTFGINTVMIDENETSYNVNYRFTFKWSTKESEGKIEEESLDISSKGILGGNFISKTSDSDVYSFRSSLNSRSKRKKVIKDNSLLINFLINDIEKDDIYLEILKELNNISFLVEDHLDANGMYDFDAVQIKGENTINIPRIIWEIKENHNSHYKMLIEGFKQLFPNITDVKCREVSLNYDESKLPPSNSKFDIKDNVYTLYIFDPNLSHRIPIDGVSDGTKRVLLTLTAAVNANINNLSVLALEEPENSIHPKLLQIYISILDALSGDCKIIFTSHSPYIIQYINPNDIVLGLPTENGLADFRYIKKGDKLIKDASIEGYSTGDFIFSTLSFDNAAEMLNPYLSDSQIDDNCYFGEEE